MPTFDTPGPVSLDVEIGIGDLRIEASDRTDTTVEVRPTDPAKRGDVVAADQTRVECSGDRLVIKAPNGWRQWMPRRGDSIDVVIGLPAGSPVRAEVGVVTVRIDGRIGACRCKVGAGNISVGEAGPVNLRTGVGDIALDRAVGRADVVTGSGGVRIGAVEGPAAVKNANGDTWIGSVTGDARVSAANGSITVERTGSGIVAKTANGAVRVGEVGHGTAVVQSAFGDIEIGIRPGVAAWLALSTKFGEVRNDLDAAGSPGAGEETVEVHAGTSYGDISVHRSSIDGPVREAS